MTAHIAAANDISPTAREVVLDLPEPLNFIPGAFVNVFMEIEGVRARRAYSISSDETIQDVITLTIRKGSLGGMSERFWDESITAIPVEIMGPLGLNTSDKISGTRVFLFGFGIGVSVIKGLLPHLLRRKNLKEITVMIASRNEEEALYKEFFEEQLIHNPHLKLKMVLSQPFDPKYPYKGHLQDHINGLDFTDASIYICGSKVATESLRDAIENEGKKVGEFFLEAFD
ncbi:MAG: CDP-4-dehydro-6-deoxyglucose reductase [Parcubacteria bacterium C7867-008]|nr:MAG: CDP-4-dehydro-6-deoxyglucose reductase [Parcubacteria bacterium C7867-008]